MCIQSHISLHKSPRLRCALRLKALRDLCALVRLAPFKTMCKVGSLPSSYLGLPLGVAFKVVEAWDRIEERIRRRLAMWKRIYISKGGRIILIRSTLPSLPIYFMSLFPIPRSIRMRFEWI